MELIQRRRGLMGIKGQLEPLDEIVIDTVTANAAEGEAQINRLLSAKGLSIDNKILIRKHASTYGNNQVLAILYLNHEGTTLKRFLRYRDNSHQFYAWGNSGYDAVMHTGDVYVVADMFANNPYRKAVATVQNYIANAGTLSNFLKEKLPDAGRYLVYRQLSSLPPSNQDFCFCHANNGALATGHRYTASMGVESIRAWTNNYGAHAYAGDRIYYVPIAISQEEEQNA